MTQHQRNKILSAATDLAIYTTAAFFFGWAGLAVVGVIDTISRIGENR